MNTFIINTENIFIGDPPRFEVEIDECSDDLTPAQESEFVRIMSDWAATLHDQAGIRERAAELVSRIQASDEPIR